MKQWRRAVLWVAIAFSAQAQSLPRFSLSHFTLNDGNAAALTVATGDTLGAQRFRGTLGFHYENNPLVYYRDQVRVGAVVAHRGQAQLGLGFGLTSWLQLAAELPVVVLQQGDDVKEAGFVAPDSWGLGSPRLALRTGLLSRGSGGLVSGVPLDCAVQLGVGFPFGLQNALNIESGWALMPQLSLGRDWGSVRVGGEVSGVVRPLTSLTSASAVGSQLAVRAVVSSVGEGARFELSAHAVMGLAGSTGVGVELLTGARIPIGPLEFLALGGPGFGDLPGTPSFRLWAGFGLRSQTDPCGPGQAHTSAQCPALDDDGDGLANGIDLCPKVAEDHDGFQDADGCLDSDNDADELVDGLDACPNQPGLATHRGCPIGFSEPERPVVPAPVKNAEPPAPSAPSKQMLALEPIRFARGKATLLEESLPRLNRLAEQLRQRPELSLLTIEGHVVSQGSPALNHKLSVNRARAVKAYLEHRGVNGARMQVVGYGAERPRSSTGQLEPERIELVIERQESR